MLSKLRTNAVIRLHRTAPKVVRFESKWIARLSLFVKLSLAISSIYLMCQRTSYQIFDRSPISAVTIKVKPAERCSINSKIMSYFPHYNCSQSTYDVNDFIVPATENSAVTIATRIREIGHVLQPCHNTSIGKNRNKFHPDYAAAPHTCNNPARCIAPPVYRHIYENDTIVREPQLCWFRLSEVPVKWNYQALDYILFIKHYVEFPQLGLVRNNLISSVHDEKQMKTCEYHPDNDPLCPKFRISKILEMVVNDSAEYSSTFRYGSLIEIKISWKCNLDKRKDLCQPQYKFRRLDYHRYLDNPYQLGSKFLTARHFFRPNDTKLYRVHKEIYNLHIVVSVTGEVGELDWLLATTSIGSFIGIFCAGTIACDLIAAFFTNFKSIKYDS